MLFFLNPIIDLERAFSVVLDVLPSKTAQFESRAVAHGQARQIGGMVRPNRYSVSCATALKQCGSRISQDSGTAREQWHTGLAVLEGSGTQHTGS